MAHWVHDALAPQARIFIYFSSSQYRCQQSIGAVLAFVRGRLSVHCHTPRLCWGRLISGEKRRDGIIGSDIGGDFDSNGGGFLGPVLYCRHYSHHKLLLVTI